MLARAALYACAVLLALRWLQEQPLLPLGIAPCAGGADPDLTMGMGDRGHGAAARV